MQPPDDLHVGASSLAMVANDDAGFLMPRGAWKLFVGTPPGASSLLQRLGAEFRHLVHRQGPASGVPSMLCAQLGPELFSGWTDGCGWTREVDVQGDIPTFVKRSYQTAIRYFLFRQAAG